MRVAREELAGPGQRVELSGSQCSSSSIDRQSWWEEAFPCSCSPMSSSSMPMISCLTNRCSRSTIPMSSPSSLKVSEQIETTSLCLRIIVMFISNHMATSCIVFFVVSAVHSAKQVHRGGCNWSRQASVLR